MIETWLWEKEQSHRLFNFHEGYRVFDTVNLRYSLNGTTSGGTSSEIELIGSHVIAKNGSNDIQFLPASQYSESYN